MINFILVIIAIILCVVFWRILFPIAGIIIIGIGIVGLLVYLNEQDSQKIREHEKISAQAKFDKAREILRSRKHNTDAKWKTIFVPDPASGELKPRSVSIHSNDGMFLVRAEVRHDGSNLISFISLDDATEFSYYGYSDTLPIKFDGWDYSRNLEVRKFSNSNDIYIRDKKTYNQELNFETFVTNLADQKTLAIYPNLKHLGKEWITFPLNGSREVLETIGMIKPIIIESQTSVIGEKKVESGASKSDVLEDDSTTPQKNNESKKITNEKITVEKGKDKDKDKILIPENAYVLGNRWVCNNGYQRKGDNCVALVVPENAYVLGNRWVCSNGYQRKGDTCIKMVLQ